MRVQVVTHHLSTKQPRYSSVSMVCNRCGHTWESTARSAFVLAGFNVRDVRTEWTDLNHPQFYYDPEFVPFCLARLGELAELKPGWDGEGAPAIDSNILIAAREMIGSLPRFVAARPMVVPLTSGGVQLEWHKGRTVLELEFESPDTVHYLKWDPDNEIEEESTLPVTQKEELVALIRWFMERDGCAVD